MEKSGAPVQGSRLGEAALRVLRVPFLRALRVKSRRRDLSLRSADPSTPPETIRRLAAPAPDLRSLGMTTLAPVARDDWFVLKSAVRIDTSS